MKKDRHAVIVVPGLGDQKIFHQLLTQSWRNYGLTVFVHPMMWYQGKTFRPKLQGIVHLIDSLTKTFTYVSLIGTSAGGSAVLNAFLARKNTVHRVIVICARLRPGQHRGLRSFERRTNKSPAFRQSVLAFSKREHLLTEKDRMKIMTVRARFSDELVPADTAILRGATNITIPTVEHMLTGVFALTLFKKKILAFLL